MCWCMTRATGDRSSSVAPQRSRRRRFRCPIGNGGQTARQPGARRRNEIIDRLRVSGCVIYEPLGLLTVISAPDGAFRIESWSESDERSAWETVRIADASGDVVLELPGYGLSGAIWFPGPGRVILPVIRGVQREQIQVNVAAHRYCLHPAEPEEPIEGLSARLYATAPGRPDVPAKRARIRPLFSNIGWLIADFMFVTVGIWMTVAGGTMKNRLIGAASAVFFGLCGIPPWIDLLPLDEITTSPARKGIWQLIRAKCRVLNKAVNRIGRPVSGNMEKRLMRLAAVTFRPEAGILFLLCLLGPAAFVSAKHTPRRIEIKIEDLKYKPAEIEVGAGDTVVWVNDDDTDHLVKAEDGSFNSGRIATGRSFEHKFDKTGKFVYRDDLHPRMKGTVTVTE